MRKKLEFPPWGPDVQAGLPLCCSQTTEDRFSHIAAMRGSREFCQKGSKFDKVFFIIIFILMSGEGSKYHY